jgi:hypothetical protein
VGKNYTYPEHTPRLKEWRVADAMIKAYEHAPAERQRPLNIAVRYSYTDP